MRPRRRPTMSPPARVVVAFAILQLPAMQVQRCHVRRPATERGDVRCRDLSLAVSLVRPRGARRASRRYAPAPRSSGSVHALAPPIAATVARARRAAELTASQRAGECVRRRAASRRRTCLAASRMSNGRAEPVPIASRPPSGRNNSPRDPPQASSTPTAAASSASRTLRTFHQSQKLGARTLR